MEHRKYKLRDIATVEISGVDKKHKEGESPVRLCNFVDVYYNWAITSEMGNNFMEATARPNEIERFKLKKGQVAITKDSETRFDIGIATYIADDFDNVILGYHNALITPNPEKLNGKYLNALLHTDYARKYFANNASGSGQRYALSVDALNDFPVPLIPLEEQIRIGNIFSSIDQKIALNRAINDNLEAMAKQIYDYWFIQFDFPNDEGKPYKSSGGKMVWNEKLKREIPEGWDADALNTWLEIKSGFPFKSETYQTIGRYKVITIKNVQDGELVTSGCDFVEEIPSRAKEYIALKIGDRLISLTGNCGRLCVVCEENLLLNQRVGLLSCNSLYLEYLYNLLNSQPMRMVVDNLANGAAQANLSPVELCKTICTMPQEDTLLEYNRKANVFRLAMVQNNQEIAALTKQRDELLPLLMNGQVSVNYHLSDD
ncbi:MAG: restriction endonuclease subunit S [Bacteroidaceae bacterium]|nr:restriction endonuclease subunit S [Bacteroidaceae bacterium]